MPWSSVTLDGVARSARYAFLLFLYDDAAGRIWEANNKFLNPSVGTCRNA
jgi:hypothetical protein